MEPAIGRVLELMQKVVIRVMVRGHRRNCVGVNVLWADDLNRHVISW